MTGEIIGNIDGRIHDESHLKMWIGSKDDTDRVICQWKKIDDVWQPDMEEGNEKRMFISIDKRETKLRDHEIDVKTKKLKKKKV